MLLRPAVRASDADRERALDALKRAWVQGRIAADELEDRAERAACARTGSELDRVLADLPGAYAAPPPATRERAVLSSLRRTGRWQPAARSRYAAVLGSVDVDLRRAALPDSDLEVELAVWLGSARIRVPAGVRLEVTGGGVLCSSDVRIDAPPPPAGAPVVRVHLRGLLGSAQVRCHPRLRDQLSQGARRLIGGGSVRA